MNNEKCLTVKELIDLLSKLPADAEVWAEVWDGYQGIQKVSVDGQRVILTYTEEVSDGNGS